MCAESRSRCPRPGERLSREMRQWRLEEIALPELDEVIVEAWLSRAPKPLAQRYIDTRLAP
jgi:hypothetical protein